MWHASTKRKYLNGNGQVVHLVSVHLQLHLDLRDHQGQVHAEPARPTSLRLPPIAHQEQDHQRPRTFHRSAGT